MLLASWNVNGIRSVINKNALQEFAASFSPDILCLQETKAQPDQVELPLELGGYRAYWNSADKKGYSGVVVFTREEPENLTLGMGIEEHDREGRVITLEFPDFHLVNVYTPNSQNELKRLDYRMKWDEDFRHFLADLARTGKPVVFCGDLNVAHQEIDIARPKENRRSAGFTDEERESFARLLESGFTDTFRHLHPGRRDAYTWWSFRGGARARNVGWRIDYFGASDPFVKRVSSAEIHPEVLGSDHCPVSLKLK
jgi:exodeoxyribonuclease-3